MMNVYANHSVLALADTIAISSIERVFEISAAVILATVTFEALNCVFPEETCVNDDREERVLTKS
ncbi:hypothetical protein LA52FAK_39050 [Desulforhopalus sp. 52FAK]